MEELIQPSQVRMAKVSSGLEMQLGQIPGEERGVRLSLSWYNITSNYVRHKERQPANDENPHHSAKRLGGFCLFGEPRKFPGHSACGRLLLPVLRLRGGSLGHLFPVPGGSSSSSVYPQRDLALPAPGPGQLLGPGGEAPAVGGGRLVDPDVGEHHDGQRAVERHGAGEHQVADIVREGTFPVWSRA